MQTEFCKSHHHDQRRRGHHNGPVHCQRPFHMYAGAGACTGYRKDPNLRAVLNTLGDGFVEAAGDQTFLTIAANQPGQSNGVIHGEAIQVPILEAPGQTGVGKFGWKDQDPTILSFSGDAYLNEMGVTNRLKPKDVTSVCKVTTDPEDIPDALGLADIDHFAQFIRGTQVPPRDTVLAATPDAIAGQNLFNSVGCVTCHVRL